MATSNKALNDKIRADYLEKVKDFFASVGEEVLVTGSGEICMPCVDTEGNEKWVQLVVKVPTGSRDGEPFDGYSLAEDYQMKLDEKAAKAENNAINMVALETVTNQYLGGDSSLSCSVQTQTEIDSLVVSLVKKQHEKAVEILKENRSKLDELAMYLYNKETITGDEFMKILNAE